MNSKSRSASDDGNASDSSESTDSSSIMNEVELTRTMKTSAHKKRGSEISDSNGPNKKRARERENTCENIKGASSVFKVFHIIFTLSVMRFH